VRCILRISGALHREITGLAMRRLVLVTSLLVLSAALFSNMPAAGADPCPTAATGKNGFVVERSGSSETEVIHVDNAVVRTVMRSGGRMLLETTQFEGLLQLERIDRGRRTTFKPKAALDRLFPLKVGQRASAEFKVQDGDKPPIDTKFLLEVKAKDLLYIGACRYDVLRVELTQTREGTSQLSIDYYSPDLKLIIAKEYKERDGRTNLIKFDRIYPSRR
jgi:hypothetical protein